MRWTGWILAVLLVVCLGIVAVLAWQGHRKPLGTPQYVALGSSFAAGIGLGPREPESPYICMRSTNGYPHRLAGKLGLSLVDVACSGATTHHVSRGGQAFLGPQIDAITKETRLVTITAGGNDIGYVGDLGTMAAANAPNLLGRIIRWFASDPSPDKERGYVNLRASLLGTLKEVRRRAPQAKIVVATYPSILPPKGSCAKLGLTVAQAANMRAVGERLAEVTREAARESGALIADMQIVGAGHNVCSREPWVNGWVDAAGTRFHPTLAGAEATAAEIERVLGAPPHVRLSRPIAGPEASR